MVVRMIDVDMQKRFRINATHFQLILFYMLQHLLILLGNTFPGALITSGKTTECGYLFKIWKQGRGYLPLDREGHFEGEAAIASPVRPILKPVLCAATQ